MVIWQKKWFELEMNQATRLTPFDLWAKWEATIYYLHDILSILYVAIINSTFFTLIFATSKNNKEYIMKHGCMNILPPAVINLPEPTTRDFFYFMFAHKLLIMLANLICGVVYSYWKWSYSLLLLLWSVREEHSDY